MRSRPHSTETPTCLESDVAALMLGRGALGLAVVSCAVSCVMFEKPLDGERDAESDDQEIVASEPDAAVTEPDAEVPVACQIKSTEAMDECTGAIVINEIDGSGQDFVEIYNRGDVAVNLSNWVIANDSGGNPDVADGTIIPVGTVLEPQRFLYVWSNLEKEVITEPKLFSECIPASPPPCLHSRWGVSAGGERIYLLDSKLTMVCALTYPGTIFGGEAFGRFPDGSSQLCATEPKPGEPNVLSSLR